MTPDSLFETICHMSLNKYGDISVSVCVCVPQCVSMCLGHRRQASSGNYANCRMMKKVQVSLTLRFAQLGL